MSLYQRGKSWWYDFWYHGECYRGCIGPVSKTVAKEILATKKAEAVKGWYELPSKKPSPRLGDFVKTTCPTTRRTVGRAQCGDMKSPGTLSSRC